MMLTSRGLWSGRLFDTFKRLKLAEKKLTVNDMIRESLSKVFISTTIQDLNKGSVVNVILEALEDEKK